MNNKHKIEQNNFWQYTKEECHLYMKDQCLSYNTWRINAMTWRTWILTHTGIIKTSQEYHCHWYPHIQMIPSVTLVSPHNTFFLFFLPSMAHWTNTIYTHPENTSTSGVFSSFLFLPFFLAFCYSFCFFCNSLSDSVQPWQISPVPCPSSLQKHCHQ